MKVFALKCLILEYFGSEISKNNIFLSQSPTIHFLLLGNRQELKSGDSWAQIYPNQKNKMAFFLHIQNQAFKIFEKLELIKNPTRLGLQCQTQDWN